MTPEETKKLMDFIARSSNPPQEVVYRLYYDEAGNVITYTIDELPGKYIVVSHKQYTEARTNVTIVDDKIVEAKRRILLEKYVKNLDGGVKTSKYDINIISDIDSVYWKHEQYDES